MTQNSNGHKWRKYAILFGVPLFILAWVWLAGAIFMAGNGLNAKEATPLTLYQYWYYYGDIKKTQAWITGAAFGSLLVLLLPVFLYFMPKKESLFGDARWATEKEIKDSGLYSEDGIIVGVKTAFFGLIKKYLIFGGAQHVLMAAPTRSGKGVSIVIPNLLSWKDSVVVLDIKQENLDITLGFRAKHGQ